jgi:hypothetical protein
LEVDEAVFVGDRNWATIAGKSNDSGLGTLGFRQGDFFSIDTLGFEVRSLGSDFEFSGGGVATEKSAGRKES